MKKVFLGCLVLALTLTGCATASTGADMIAVHYTGGAATAKKFKGCLDPSTRSGFDPGDAYYGYPVRQVSYDASPDEASERGRFTVVSEDGAELYVPVSVTFNLITDCETLRKMHETVGSRFDAYYDANGSTSDENEGWINMLNFVIGKPLDATLDRVAKEYTWREIWNDNEVKVEMEQAITDSIDDLVSRQAGGEFFQNFQVLVQSPDPVDEGLKAAIADEQSMVAKSKAQEAQARADQARAEAQEAVAMAEAANKRATIEGFMLRGMSEEEAMEAYLRAEAIKAGLNPWQPTYKVSDSR